MVNLLHKLFCLCWKNRLIPDIWRCAIIHLIPKNHLVSIDPLKYRGLSLQSCIYKILSNLINERIIRYLEEQKIIADEQNGFRAKRSCVHHIHTLVSLVKKQIHEHKQLFTCFIDFSKAFDVMDRDLLFMRLLENGIRGSIFSLIEQMYKNTTSVIRLNGCYSNELDSKHGVKQGDNLSQTLFILYINSLLRDLNSKKLGVNCGQINVCSLAYADDIVLISETADGLQSLMNTVNDWCKCWRVLINPLKTKVVHFRRKGTPVTTCGFKIGIKDIELTGQYKYLGLTLDEHLNFDEGISQLVGAGSRALSAVIGKTRNNFDLGYRSFTRLLNCCVMPVLDYASGVWSLGRDAAKIDNIHL